MKINSFCIPRKFVSIEWKRTGPVLRIFHDIVTDRTNPKYSHARFRSLLGDAGDLWYFELNHDYMDYLFKIVDIPIETQIEMVCKGVLNEIFI